MMDRNKELVADSWGLVRERELTMLVIDAFQNLQTTSVTVKQFVQMIVIYFRSKCWERKSEKKTHNKQIINCWDILWITCIVELIVKWQLGLKFSS